MSPPTSLQWGCGCSAAEAETDLLALLGGVGFNGAAAVQPRRRFLARMLPRPVGRFNVAAAVQPRRQQWFLLRGDAHWELQWGRG